MPERPALLPSRSVALAAALVAALAALLVAFPDLARDPHGDFVEYWAAGRLNLARDNPYDPARMLAIEREVGWVPPYPMMMWNPPWTLTFVMPLGAMPFPLARGLWMLVQFAVTLGCAVSLWRFYGGRPDREPWAVLLAVLFAPLLLSLKYGQIGPLVLLGLTGFLAAQSRERDVLAGVFLALASVKPHLVYAVWPAVAAWSVWAGRWRVWFGMAAAGVALAAVPAAVNPDVYAQFVTITTDPPPSSENFRGIRDWDSPTFGWQLRKLIGREFFRLQYVPPLLGLVWLAWYLWRHRRQWDWGEQLPVLLLVSVCTAAYGAWPADSLVLLPALTAVATGVSPDRARLALVVLFTLTVLTLAIERGPTTEPYVWVPPLYGLAFWCFTRGGKDGGGSEHQEVPTRR